MPSLSLKDYQENRYDRGIYDRRNNLNDLTGKEWLFSTKTVIPKEYSSIWPKDMKSRNYNPIPIELSRELVETFSKPGDTILDPFAGIGSTLIGSFYANGNYNPPRRNYIGIETNKKLIDRYNQFTKKLNIPNQGMLIGEPIRILSELKDRSIDFILTDIPIWDISDPNNIENIGMDFNNYCKSPEVAIHHWCSSISKVFLEVMRKLKESKYLVIAIHNERYKGKLAKQDFSLINFPLSAILTFRLQELGLVLKAERIWFDVNSSEPDTIYKRINRRFFVFRNEFSVKSNFNNNYLFFEEKIPEGNTYIIHKAFPPSFNHKLRSEHGGMKPPELAQILIEKYSKKEKDDILDPFAGVGGTLLGASLSRRNAIGIDINERWKDIYNKISQENNLVPQKFLIGDSRKLINQIINDNSIDLVLTDVPYWAMDKLQKTRGRFSKAGEESKGKLHTSLHSFNETSILTIEEWLDLLRTVFTQCYSKLIDGKYLVVFIGNMYRTMDEVRDGKVRKVGKYLFLSSLLAKALLEIGYSFRNEIVWYSPDKSLHVFGYPYSYIPSVVHQSILVFKK